MKCDKCGNEKKKIKLPIGAPMYTCEHCQKEKMNADDKLKQAKRDSELLEMRTKAGISKRLMGSTFDSFKTNTDAEITAKRKCMEYLDAVKNKRAVGGLMMVGTVGAGKSLMACAMIEAMGYDDCCCRRRTIADLTLELKETFNRNSVYSEKEFIEFYSNIDLLILDEVGVMRGSETEALMLFQIIDGRYNSMLPTVLISNLDINGLKSAIGERVIDRLRDGGGKVVAFVGESKRK